MLEVLQQAEQEGHEQDAHAQNVPAHGAGDDVVRRLARRLLHHAFVRRQRGQGQRGEGVHDEVDPEHLRDGEGGFRAQERADEHNEAGRHVDGHLEDDEALDIPVQGASPHDGAGNAHEGIVQDGDGAGFLGYGSAVPHGEAHLSGVQGGGVVGAVPGNGHYLVLFLEQLYQPFLIHGPGTAHDFQIHHAVQQFRIRSLLKLYSRHQAVRRVLLRPQADLSSDFPCGAGGVPRNDLDTNARVHAVLHGLGHIVPDGVGNGGDAQVNQILADNAAVFEYRGVILQNAVCEAQRTHGLVLIGQELFLNGGTHVRGGNQAFRCQDGGAEAQHDFRRAFHVKDFFTQQGGFRHGGHVLAFRGESKLFQHAGVFPQIQVIHAQPVQPQEERPFRGISQGLDMPRIRVIQKGGGVDGDSLPDQIAQLVFRRGSIPQAVEISLVYVHLVARQGSRLVRADDGGGPHGFAGVHLAHQIIVGEHALHAQGQAQGDAHGQPFRHRDYDDGHGDHDGIQNEGSRAQPFHGAGQVGEVKGKPPDDDEGGDSVAGPGDEVPQPGKLAVEGRLHLIVDLGAFINLAVFRPVPYGRHFHDAVAIRYGGSFQNVVGGVSGVFLEFRFIRGFADEGFPRQRGFVDLEGNGFQQDAVRRDLLSCVQDNDIAHHHVPAGQFADIAAADDLDHGVVIDLVQDFKLFVGAYLEGEPHAGSQQDGRQDARGLQKDAGRFRSGEKLVESYAYGQEQGHQQNLDNGV